MIARYSLLSLDETLASLTVTANLDLSGGVDMAKGRRAPSRMDKRREAEAVEAGEDTQDIGGETL